MTFLFKRKQKLQRREKTPIIQNSFVSFSGYYFTVSMMENLIEVRSYLCESGCNLTIDGEAWILILYLILILSLITSIYYTCKQDKLRKKSNRQDIHLTKCKSPRIKIANISDSIETGYQITAKVTFYIRPIAHQNICKARTITLSRIIQAPSSIENQKLICFCDGSYSHYMKVGHSGFLASDGTHKVKLYSCRNSKYGSTNTEVLAAYLAIQYALEKNYKKLVIYTDNSKVDQLLQNLKEKDTINYPAMCQVLSKYRKENGRNSIQVIRVHGHTSKSEQQQCRVKHEFAKIDKLVRQKTRHYIKRWWNSYSQNYYYYQPAYYSYNQYELLRYYIETI